MIDIIQSPYRTAFTKNCIKFGVQSDNYIATQGISSNLTMVLTPFWAIGNTITISLVLPNTFGSVDLQMVVVASATLNGVDLPAYDTGLPLADNLQSVIAHMSSNQILGGLFLFSYDDNNATITLTLKEEDGTTATASSTGVFPILPFSYVWTNGSSTTYREGFKIIAKVYFEPVFESNDFVKIAESDASIDAEGKASFVIDTTLDDAIQSAISGDFLSDQMLAIVAPTLSNNRRRYYVLFSEYYYDSGAYKEHNISLSDKLDCVYGGLPSKEAVPLSYFQDLASYRHFLTFWSYDKMLSEDQKDFLSFYCYQAMAPVLLIDVYYNDGTTQSVTINWAVSYGEGDIFTFGIGYGQLGIATINVTKTAAYYTLHLEDGAGNILSEEKKYIINYDYLECFYDYYWINGLGHVEGFRATGLKEANLQIEKMVSQKVLCWSDSPMTGELSQYTHSSTHLYTGRIGVHYTREQVMCLEDFLAADYKYELIDAVAERIITTEDKFKIGNPKDNIVELEFNYQSSFGEGRGGIDANRKYKSLAGNYTYSAAKVFLNSADVDNIILHANDSKDSNGNIISAGTRIKWVFKLMRSFPQVVMIEGDYGDLLLFSDESLLSNIGLTSSLPLYYNDLSGLEKNINNSLSLAYSIRVQLYVKAPIDEWSLKDEKTINTAYTIPRYSDIHKMKSWTGYIFGIDKGSAGRTIFYVTPQAERKTIVGSLNSSGTTVPSFPIVGNGILFQDLFDIEIDEAVITNGFPDIYAIVRYGTQSFYLLKITRTASNTTNDERENWTVSRIGNNVLTFANAINVGLALASIRNMNYPTFMMSINISGSMSLVLFTYVNSASNIGFTSLLDNTPPNKVKDGVFPNSNAMNVIDIVAVPPVGSGVPIEWKILQDVISSVSPQKTPCLRALYYNSVAPINLSSMTTQTFFKLDTIAGATTLPVASIASLNNAAATPVFGTAAAAAMNSAYNIAQQSGTSRAYISMQNHHCIGRFSLVGPSSFYAKIAGVVGVAGNANGSTASATFTNPKAVTMIGAYLYLSEGNTAAIRKIDVANGLVSFFSGRMTPGTQYDTYLR